jgi:hypothetical protein
LKEKISALKDELKEIREDMQSQLDQERQDICVLQEQLHQKIELPERISSNYGVIN